MKEPSHGPTEILCFPDGHKTIVTKVWWGKFLAAYEKDLTSTSTSLLASQHRGNTAHGQVVQQR